MEREQRNHVPHVLFLPFLNLQGHTRPMMMLADLLSHAGGFQVSFVLSNHYHDRLLRHTDLIRSFRDRFPKFVFKPISDGLPPDHPRSASHSKDFITSVIPTAKAAIRQLLVSLSEEEEEQPLTCIICDGIMFSAAFDAAQEFHIPIITFRTLSASCFWTYFHLSKLIEQGEVPFPDENLDKPITCIPGLENVFRRRDLPSMCRVEKSDDPSLQFHIGESCSMARACAAILNTFDELEGPVISRLGSIYSKLYTIGPLHNLVKSITKSDYSSNGILWKEDNSCMTWLDSQASRSVVYVNFGTFINVASDHMLELWHGLVNSGKLFLWVMRPDLVVGESGLDPVELQMGAKERGLIVRWAPQEDVLAHPAIGAFLTHSGWNSTLESIVSGVPMICWPHVFDQLVNSRYVSEVWKIGVDMKDSCDRSTVEKMVRELMDDTSKREEIMQSLDRFAKMARDSVKEGGSSYCNLDKLIEYIRSMSSKLPQ